MTVPVLDEIAKKVNSRLAERKKLTSIEELKDIRSAHKPIAFESLFLGQGYHVIAEIKKASPSEGDIAPEADPVKTAQGYLDAGALALSVLTESDFFKGNLGYLESIRTKFPDAPLLMKDFILEEYQIHEGRVAGADAVLLIVAMLGAKKSAELFLDVQKMGLQALVEVHDEEEFKIALDFGATLIGVNNRNLKTMEISLKTSENLAKLAPAHITLISESGLKNEQEIRRLKMLGFKGFLMGTSFMKSPNPGFALKNLLDGLS